MADLKRITAEEMEEHLRVAYSGDPETSFLHTVGRALRDPAMAQAGNNRPRPHPLWLTLILAGLFGLGVFLYFSFVRS